MFNRALQVKMVKNPKPNSVTDNEIDTTAMDVATVVAEAMNRIVVKIALAGAGYVVLDTVRQVLVAKANK